MFVNRAGDSAMRGGGGAMMDENASLRNNNNTTSKTPTATKRRAFGDISNRKNANGGTKNITTKKTPHVPTTTTRKSKIVAPSTLRKVTFAVPKNNTPGNNLITTKSKLAPVDDVEVSAGRVWSDQQSYFDEDDVGVEDILEEQKLWEQEVSAFCEEERTRHVKIREHQNAMAEKELEEQMEALWKQDDEDLAAADLDNLMLESVQSFDDLSLDKEEFGPYSFPDDISF